MTLKKLIPALYAFLISLIASSFPILLALWLLLAGDAQL